MKRALVISGGGSKGAFAVGVLKGLRKIYPRLDFDVYVGTSTGSLIVPLAALHEWDLLETLYTTQREGSVLKKLRLGDRLSTDSIFDANPLFDLIGRYYTNERADQLLTSAKKLFINCTCLQTGNITVFTNDQQAESNERYEVRKIENADHFRRAVMASACQPVFMPAIEVNRNLPGHPEQSYQYVDGGVREYAGIEMAIDAGATEIFTVLLSASQTRPENRSFTDLFSILQRTIDLFSTDVGKNDLLIPAQYNEALKYIEAVKRKMVSNGLSRDKVTEYFHIRGRESPFEDKVPLKLFNIRPDLPLGGGPGGLVFDPDEMKGMMALGAAHAHQFAASLRPSDITWS